MNYIRYNDPQNLNLPKYVIESLTDRRELAHIRSLDSKTYIILTVPKDETATERLCVETDGTEITVYVKENLDNLLHQKPDSFPELVLSILKTYEHLINDISQRIDHFENIMDSGISKENIKNFFGMSRKLIFYQTGINAIGDISRYITEEKYTPLWNETYASDFTNIRIEINQLDQNIEMYQQIIDSMMNVSDSLFSNKLNKTMKTLTSITLILSIPTFITSFYGMNINLPFQDHPHALLIVFIMSLSITVITVIYLYRHDLL
ncbi:magnesium transporter CorA family protein [Erysipelothrix inopinata]|uniref:Magnesium transporter CorA family protein n=1 Tax=Erysipelothrix inopinata TaxID=225084 RepID=A0A7G9RWD4_9FIRM|nr:magnesium transporter CorA family protein [Erysipelothrix inopinata]QNN59909.1 magnesium transporter CorA family protein [Erysipelothrix inopinata]